MVKREMMLLLDAYGKRRQKRSGRLGVSAERLILNSPIQVC